MRAHITVQQVSTIKQQRRFCWPCLHAFANSVLRGCHGLLRQFTTPRKTTLRKRPSTGRATVVQHIPLGDGADSPQKLDPLWSTTAPTGSGMIGRGMRWLS